MKFSKKWLKENFVIGQKREMRRRLKECVPTIEEKILAAAKKSETAIGVDWSFLSLAFRALQSKKVREAGDTAFPLELRSGVLEQIPATRFMETMADILVERSTADAEQVPEDVLLVELVPTSSSRATAKPTIRISWGDDDGS